MAEFTKLVEQEYCFHPATKRVNREMLALVKKGYRYGDRLRFPGDDTNYYFNGVVHESGKDPFVSVWREDGRGMPLLDLYGFLFGADNLSKIHRENRKKVQLWQGMIHE